MSRFFQQIAEDGSLSNAAVVLDWLFDDAKFSHECWTRGSKQRLTKILKRLEGFGDSTFCRKTNQIAYPENKSTRNRCKKPYALFSSSVSLGEDFIRHIRNAIAHGKANVYTVKGIKYVELVDFGVGGHQTAFIAMPIEYLSRTYVCCQEIENSYTHDKKKGKK